MKENHLLMGIGAVIIGIAGVILFKKGNPEDLDDEVPESQGVSLDPDGLDLSEYLGEEEDPLKTTNDPNDFGSVSQSTEGDWIANPSQADYDSFAGPQISESADSWGTSSVGSTPAPTPAKTVVISKVTPKKAVKKVKKKVKKVKKKVKKKAVKKSNKPAKAKAKPKAKAKAKKIVKKVVKKRR